MGRGRFALPFSPFTQARLDPRSDSLALLEAVVTLVVFRRDAGLASRLGPRPPLPSP